MRDYGWPIEFGLLASILGSALLGLVFGWIAIRRSGIYFAMITLALAQAVYFLAVQEAVLPEVTMDCTVFPGENFLDY